MTHSIHPAAVSEAADAVRFYESRDPELGVRFQAEIFASIERARMQPRLYREFEAGLRKVKTDRFPYFLIFRVCNERQIQILAIAHASRRPGYWKKRL
ncbi:MAG: type II toxin-antitoxin system RelE/ParE family toxin [Verrucomicrobiales bacterium]|nr:type II toxin-antitoxin system RelE/ParE family toxin [Verrucomicrobiales bacterium]MCP5557560.1 type II toxin-antitoxin system RelE/ParE family toxin [Verrucomicrobiaceae bacterium]